MAKKTEARKELEVAFKNGYQTLKRQVEAGKTIDIQFLSDMDKMNKTAHLVGEFKLIQAINDLYEWIQKDEKPVVEKQIKTKGGKKPPVGKSATTVKTVEITANSEEAPPKKTAPELVKEAKAKAEADKKALALKKAAELKKQKAQQVTAVEDTSPEIVPLAKMFPETMSIPGEKGIATVIRGEITVEEIGQMLDEDRVLYFATYWTKRHIDQFNYAEGFKVILPKKFGFENDLDLVQVVHVCEKAKGKLYAMSTTTDAMYAFFDFELVEFEDGLRVSNNMEFQVYEYTEEVPKKKTPVKK